MTITITVGGSAVAVRPFSQNPPSPSGWTDPVPSWDTVIAYVSSSAGNDSWNGFFPDHTLGGNNGPKATVFAGRSLLTPGHPDWLLLARGDVWTNISLGHWTTNGQITGTVLSGRNPNERMLIGAYGTGDRPQLQYGSNTGFIHRANAPVPLNNLYVIGVHFNAHTHNGTNPFCAGFDFEGQGSDILVEDCLFEKGAYGIWFTEDQQKYNVKIRRNVVRDSQSFSNGCGIYVGATSGAVTEQNFLDNNGTNISESSLVRHGIFISETCFNPRTRGNVVSRTSSVAIYSACGYNVQDNVTIQNPYGLICGSIGPAYVQGGVPIDCVGNLVIEGRNGFDSPATLAGVGITIYNCAAGNVNANIVTQNVGTASLKAALRLIDSGQQPIQNLTILENIFYKWGPGIFCTGTGQFFNVSVHDNDVQEPTLTGNYPNYLTYIPSANYVPGFVACGANRYTRGGAAGAWFRSNVTEYDLAGWMALIGDTTSTSTAVAYANAARTIGAYHGSIGGTATTQGYIDSFRVRHRHGSGGTLWADNLAAAAVLTDLRAAFVG